MIGFYSLLTLFVVTPLLELFVLIKVGGQIGPVNTILFCLLTAFIGAILVRIEGLQTFLRMQRSLQQGVVPQLEMIEGVALLVAAMLLLTPGFITDAIGFLLTIPYTRRPFASFLVSRLNLRGHRVSAGESYEASHGTVIDIDDFESDADPRTSAGAAQLPDDNPRR